MIKLLAIAITGLLPLAVQANPVLLMAEEQGCHWCEKWNDEIARIYPKTAEGRTAPLRRYDLHHEKPDVIFLGPVHYTPTFILVRDGREIGRIEGYPGADFFWGLLAMLFRRAGISPDTENQAGMALPVPAGPETGADAAFRCVSACLWQANPP